MNNLPPNVRLTPTETEALQTLFGRILELTILKQDWQKTCLSCQFFNESTEVCGKWNMRPPARVIVQSCPQWTGGQPF